ncbi:hypothetical protein ACJJIC_18775 [Microbulbifer sp. ANSA002]|uniref:hypothetical protein n=1 Tax=unclassified Microbulbifer TaxID=2619833 RepID=UPI00404243E4
MNESQLASEIANKIISDSKFWIALIGLCGAIVGSLLTFLGNFILHQLKEGPQKKLENQRIDLLKKMLDDDRFEQKWRSLSVLSAVIGASEEETKRLLFISGARGSEETDGKWGLIKNHPLPGPQNL